MTEERWKPIVGFESQYLISDQGNVFSFHIMRNMKCTKYTPSGHTAVCLARNTIGVHGLVLTHFVGPRPEHHEARHLNGLARDNRLVNLEWATYSRNTQDRKWHKGAKNHKLKPDDVRAIRKAIAQGANRLALAASYGVHRVAIDTMMRGETHKDVF